MQTLSRCRRHGVLQSSNRLFVTRCLINFFPLSIQVYSIALEQKVRRVTKLRLAVKDAALDEV